MATQTIRTSIAWSLNQSACTRATAEPIKANEENTMMMSRVQGTDSHVAIATRVTRPPISTVSTLKSMMESTVTLKHEQHAGHAPE